MPVSPSADAAPHRPRRGPRATALAAVPVALTVALGNSAATAEPLPVAVTLPPQAWLVQGIGGEGVRVTTLVPPGASPETWEPSPRQMVELAGTRLYFAVGHPGLAVEGEPLRRILAAHQEIERVDLFAVAAGGPHAGDDPHLWLSPSHLRAAVPVVAAALAATDPVGAERYAARAAALDDEIERLDAELTARLAPHRGRVFAVFHPAWGHFARHFGLEQWAIEEEGKEPSPRRLVALIEEARRVGVGTLFVQRGFAERGARTIAGQIGARVVVTDPLARDLPGELRRFAEALVESFGG